MATIMGFWLLSVALGNKIVEFATKTELPDALSWMESGWQSQRAALEDLFVRFSGAAASGDGQSLEQFFWFFAGLMAFAAILFWIRARSYRYQDYTQ